MSNRKNLKIDQISEIKRIQDYFNGLLNPEEMHSLENDALQDPFLQDAMEGYEAAQGVQVSKLSLLQKRLNERISERQSEHNLFFFQSNRLAIASVGLVLFILGLLLLWLKIDLNRVPEKEKQVEVILSKSKLQYEIAPAFGVDQEFHPLDGWKFMNTYITSFQPYNGTSVTSEDQKSPIPPPRLGRIHLILTTNEVGKIVEIKYKTPIAEDDERALNRLLKEGPAWHGKQGEVLLILKK